MGRNLGPLNIKDSYEGLVQISGSDQLTDGSGSLISSLDIAVSTATSASHAVIADSALTATSASHAVNADSAISSSYALTASFAENVSTPNLQEVTDVGNTTTNEVNVAELYVDNANPTDKSLHVYVTGNGIHYNLSGSTADDHMFEVNQTDIIRFQTSSITAYKDIDATGLTITANQVDATTFNGDLNGTASVSTAATIFGDNTNAERPLVFVDDNPSTGVGQVEQLRGDTTKSITYNPVTNVLTVPNTTTTASYATLALTASYAENAAGADPFPYTGSAEITGSLEVIGNIQTGTSANNIAGDFNAVIAGTSNQTTAAAEYSAVIGGINSTISGDKSVIAGCENGDITDYDNFIGGGFNQTINANKSAMVGGNSSTIAGGANNVIVAGTNHSVNGDSNVVVGGANHVISNLYERSVVIGGNTLSVTKDDEVVVPSLVATELTASGLIYPTSDGSNGDVLTTDGAGNLTLQPAAGGAAFPYTGSADISGSIDLHGYITTGFADNVISSALASHAIIGGQASEISGGTNGNVIVNGFSATISGGGVNTVVGANSTISSTGIYNGLYSNQAGSITGGSKNVRIGGTYGTISNGNSKAMVGGDSHTMSGGGSNGFIGGGSNNSITNESNNAIIAGTGNSNTSLRSVILGGENNTINAGQGGVVAGGINNTVSHDRSVILGGNTLSTSKSDEVVVDNLDINGTVVQNVQALTITSNTASLDASTGQMFTLGLQNAADTHLELSNQVAGQTFSLKITNNATAAGTITFDSQFDFEGGTAFTATAATSAVDILTFTTFDGTSVQCVGSKNFS